MIWRIFHPVELTPNPGGATLSPDKGIGRSRQSDPASDHLGSSALFFSVRAKLLLNPADTIPRTIQYSTNACPQGSHGGRLKAALEITPNLEPLFGTRDENLRLMEDSLGVRIDLRSDAVHVEGPEEAVAQSPAHLSGFRGAAPAGREPAQRRAERNAAPGGGRPRHHAAFASRLGQAALGRRQAHRPAALRQSAQIRRGHRAERHGVRRGARRAPAKLISPWPWPSPP